MAPALFGEWGPFFFCLKVFWIIYWARYYDQCTTGEAGSVKGIPNQLVILKGRCDVEDHRPTRTHVDRTKGP
jgi:hypothetical protein